MQRGTTRLLATAALVAFALMPARAFAFTVNTTVRTENDIRMRWQSAQPDYSGSPYVASPNPAAPYAAGALQPAFLDDGLDMVNFVRYLAGVPDDVVLDASLNRYDQHGTVVLAANNLLTHYPTQPSAMPSDFYTTGRTGTTSSNLARGPVELETAVKLYMADSDSHNINGLGHRRWIMNPPMAKTGMGQTSSFSAMWATDRSRSSTVDYRTINWPAAGQFPVEFFKSGTAWSITLNPAKYTVDPAGLVVTLRRASDGHTWTFTQADAYTAGQSFDREIFSYSKSGYGVPSCVIFRPQLATTYSPGDVFDVKVGGTLYAAGTTTRTTVSYRTTFMTLAGPVLPTSKVAFSAPTAHTYLGTSRLQATLAKADGSALASRSVTFESSTDGGATWRTIATAATNASGTALASFRPTVTRAKMLVRARFAGDSGIAGCSASRSIAIRPYLTLGSTTLAYSGRAFGAYGYLAHRHATGTYPVTVRAYKYVSGRWVYKTSFRGRVTSNSTTKSKYVARVTLPAGKWLLKTYHAADAYHVATYSSRRYVTVR